MTRTIQYDITIAEPWTHLVDIRMTLEAAPGDVALVLPAWAPGSYRIRDYARHVQDVRAEDKAGQPLRVERFDKNTFVVSNPAGGEVSFAYRVYGDEATVRTCHITSEHAFLSSAGLFFYVKGETDRPARVRLQLPSGWKVFTGLRALDDGSFEADDFDTLADAPLECGPHKVLQFDIDSRPHRIVLAGEGNFDEARLLGDVTAICHTAVDMMQELPVDDYTFIVHLPHTGQGGLEHLNSTVVMFPRFNFRTEEKYLDFLTLCAHEYFHLWNGKRIRPQGLGPFNYESEVHTHSLWVVEGWTSYYDELLVHRAGRMDASTYLKRLAKTWNTVMDTPGRRHQSLSQASFESWLKYYQRTPHSVNNSISYYDKGLLVACLLDLELRLRSDSRVRLDDVLRAMWQQYRKDGRAYRTETPQEVAEELVGSSLADFFARYVDGTDELPLPQKLAEFGIQTTTEEAKDDGPTLVLKTKMENGRFLVGEVLEGSAAWRDGLCVGDEILAVQGWRVADGPTLKARIQEQQPGASVALTVSRDERVRTVTLKLTDPTPEKARFELNPDADKPSRHRLSQWLKLD